MESFLENPLFCCKKFLAEKIRFYKILTLGYMSAPMNNSNTHDGNLGISLAIRVDAHDVDQAIKALKEIEFLPPHCPDATDKLLALP